MYLNLLVTIKYCYGFQFKFHWVLKYFLFWNRWITLHRLNTIKDFATSFPSLTLHAVNLLLWKKIYSVLLFSKLLQYLDQLHSSGCSLCGIRIKLSPPMSKCLNLVLLLDVTPYQKIESSLFPSYLTPFLSWLQTTYWKKVSLTAFRRILQKVLPVVHIFSFIITTYLKKFIGIKYLITKQCPVVLSPWVIPPVSPILPKIFPLLSSCLLPPPCMDYLLDETL